MSKSSQNLSKIDPIDRQIISNLIQEPGLTDKEVGQKVGLSRQAIVKRKAKERFQKLYLQRLNEIDDHTRSLVFKSLGTLNQLMDDPDPRIRLAAAIPVIKLMGDQLASRANLPPTETEAFGFLYESSIWGK